MNLPAPASAPAGPVLRDIHLPPPPPWWPPAPGWWVLALLVSALLAWAAWRMVARRRHLRARGALVALVDRALIETDGRPEEAVAALHALLRRAARRLDPHAATLRGEAWQATLGQVPVDAAVIARLAELDVLIYRPSPVIDRDALAGAVRQWLGALADRTRTGRAVRRTRS